MSKGSDRRPQKITDEQMLANWNKVFGSKQKETDRIKQDKQKLSKSQISHP